MPFALGRQVASLLELRDELGLGAGALRPFAGSAEELEVLAVVVSALGPGDDVVDLEVPERECHPAAAAVSFLDSEQPVLFRPVVRQLAQVGPLGNVRAVMDFGDDSELFAQSTFDDACCNWGRVDPDPLPVEVFCGHAGRGTGTERIEDEIPWIGADVDDAVEQCERFLCADWRYVGYDVCSSIA